METYPSMPYFSMGKGEAGGLLGRYLPPVPEAAARAFLATLPTRSPWVLDPFGSSPRFAVELARAGARVIVTAGNPVNRFLLSLAAHPPALADLQAALSDLASARKDGERLETHLQSLYLTECDHCRRELPADAFLWEHHTGALTGKIYNCACGAGGEHPATPADIERAAAWSRTDSLHRSRALGRIAPSDDPDRPYAEEALNIYLPRAVYALGTLVNRLDAITTSNERRRGMAALLLWAFDAANSLWPHPAERPRPRQLSFPNAFRENNVWMALEAGVKALGAGETSHCPVTLWPEDPSEDGGLCIFEGPLRDLAPNLREVPLQAVAGILPRPNQAFWTLSALWAGWLWRREAVGPFKGVLRRRRYDWAWHTEALKAAFSNVAEVLPAKTSFLGLVAEAEPAFLSAALLAGRRAGLTVSGLGMRGEQDAVQIRWEKAPKRLPAQIALDVNFARKTLLQILAQQGKPMPYLHLHAAAVTVFVLRGKLPQVGENLSALENILHEALSAPDFVDTQGRASPETGLWALRQWGEQHLFDQAQ